MLIVDQKTQKKILKCFVIFMSRGNIKCTEIAENLETKGCVLKMYPHCSTHSR